MKKNKGAHLAECLEYSRSRMAELEMENAKLRKQERYCEILEKNPSRDMCVLNLIGLA